MIIRNAGSLLSFVAVVAAASLLVGCGPNVADLSAKLGDPDANVRWDAAEALGRTGEAAAVDPLIGALADKESAVRNAAAEALGSLGVVAVQQLSIALSSPNPQQRELAAFALGETKCPAAVTPLARALKNDTAPSVRAEAAAALGNMAGPLAESALSGALVDQDEKVKQAASAALIRVRQRNAAPAKPTTTPATP